MSPADKGHSSWHGLSNRTAAAVRQLLGCPQTSQTELGWLPELGKKHRAEQREGMVAGGYHCILL